MVPINFVVAFTIVAILNDSVSSMNEQDDEFE